MLAHLRTANRAQGTGVWEHLQDHLEELKALIWTAIDLKTVNHAEGYRCSHLLEDRSVVVLFTHPNARMQTTLNTAIQKLGATVTTIVDLNWESKQSTEELGRFLSRLADLVCVQGEFNSSVEKIADDASVPVLSLGCCLHSTLQVLTDLMTLQEHFGRLKGLRVGWVGPACPLLNTYLLLLPRFGVDMNFSSSPCAELGSSPRCLDGAFKYCKHHNTELKEFYTVAEVIRGAQVIVTTAHNNRTLAITEKEVDNADPEWVLLHSLPRSGTEVCDSIFYSNRSLVLNSAANMQSHDQVQIRPNSHKVCYCTPHTPLSPRVTASYPRHAVDAVFDW
uniref:ornithine carbamoyltransferase n=1 Tax=Timema poppense TaxID=170557 RepID=A0A7R9DFV3_TIMPO|nr:unnamed protein product [Timema poppensis]